MNLLLRRCYAKSVSQKLGNFCSAILFLLCESLKKLGIFPAVSQFF